MPIVDPFDIHTTNTGIIDPFDAPKSAQLKIKDPFDTEAKPSFLKSAIKAPIAGIGDAIEMYSRALRTTDPEGGWDVVRNVATKGVDLGKSIAEKFPTENEDFGLVKRGVVGGIRSSVPSVAAGVPGAIAGMAGGVPGIVGGYAGSGAIITGAAEYDRFLELADQYGIPKEIARSGAIKSALVEGGIEGAANALDAILLKAGSPVVSGFKQFAKNALKIGGVESGTEAIQAALEAKIARDVGIPAPHPLEAAKEAVIPALTMGGIIGAGGTYANKILSKPEKIQQTEKQAIIDPFDNQIKPPQIQQTEKQEVVLPLGEKPLIQPLPKPENVEIVKPVAKFSDLLQEYKDAHTSPEKAANFLSTTYKTNQLAEIPIGKARDFITEYDTRGYEDVLDTEIVVTNNLSENTRASYNQDTKKIYISPKTILSKENYKPIIVHELIHASRDKKNRDMSESLTVETSADKAMYNAEKRQKILEALGRMQKNIAQEDFGRSSIENFEAMENATGFSPKEIANEFINKTYAKLDEQTKKRFDIYIGKAYGEPDSDFPTYTDVLKYEIPKNFESLEGTARGLYVLMDEANRRGRNKNQIGMPQPKGFTPIEVAPVETAQPKGFGKPQDLFAKPTEETKIVYGAIDEEVKLLEPKIPLKRRNELFEQARTEGAALMKKRMGVTDYTTLTKPIYRNLLKAEAEKQSAPIEATPVVSKEPLTSEKAQKAIDDFTDILVNKYGKEAALNAPIFPEEYKKFELPVPKTPVSEQELRQLKNLYTTRDTIDSKDFETWKSTILKESKLPENETNDVLNLLGFKDSSYGIYRTAQDLKNWTSEITDTLGKIYNHFALGAHAEFKWGGTGENPILEGKAFDEDLRRIEWDMEALRKTQDAFNAISKTQGIEPINLLNIAKGTKANVPVAQTVAGLPEKTSPIYQPRGLKEAITIRKEMGSLAGYDLQSQTEWLGGQKPKDEITIYRATPTGEEIKSGDYVTNSLEYAKQHIQNNLGGKGIITKAKATLDDIFPADAPKEFWYAPKSIELQQTHTMPSGEVMPGAEHAAGIASPEGNPQIGKTKYFQPKLLEGEKTNITPQMEADIQGPQKLFQPKAGQLTPEQLQQQTSDINIGREGMPSIKSDAEIRYAPGTGINLETLDLPPDVKHTIYKLTQQYQPQFEDARNRKTWEEINKEAESLGFDANQLLERQKGEAYNAAKLKATKDIQNNTALEAKRIADETVTLALDAKLTAEQQAEVLVIANMKMKKAAAILAQAGGAYSEAGRALNILRQVSGATKAQKNWEAILDALGGREMTLEMFKRIAGMDTTDTPQVAKFIREVQKARIPDMVSEAWRNAILSGTKTLITNPLSNAITFASNPIETGIAAVLEKGRSVITGKKPQVYFREVPAEIVGAIDGIWNGARVFLNTMKTEIPTFGETKIENAIMQTNIPGKLGRAIRVPQTILIAQDDAMKAVIYDSTMKTLATRLAISKGFKSKKEIVEFVGNLLTNPQGKNKRYFDLFDKRARADADYRTYNKALGKIGQILMRLRDQEFPKGSGIKPLYYVMPFMRTPTNIVKYGLERTPVNFARLGYKNYKGEIPSAHLSEEFAKPILGTIMFLWGWLMYEYGYMTGDAPKDVNDRASWYNAGKKPYSFYLPWLNKYISYQRIEPLGSIFGMVADFFEITNRGIANTKDAFTKILLSLTRNWTNKTFIMGATNAINAYTDPERYGDRFVDGLTSSLVPNIISSFNSDPYYRQKQTFLDSIKAKVPVLSETLPPKRDILGSPAKRGEGRGMALFNQILPFGVVKPSDDPVRKELLRLNDSISFSVGMPNKYFRRGKEKIDISADVYDAYSKESGELAYKLVNRIVKSKGYGKMDDENKASLIRKQFDVARDSVRPKYIRQLKQNPQIGR